MITKEYLQQELVKRIDGYKRGVETSTDNIVAEMKSILVLVDALPDYEKKYNEAFAWIRDIYPTLTGMAKEDAEHYFPELRESEDERIRKSIVATIEQCPDDFLNPKNRDKMLAYLERQKEHHIPWYDYQKSKEDGYTIVPNEEYERLIKQKEQEPQVFCEAKAYDLGYKQGKEDAIKEQKPAEWSKEDEDKLYQVMGTLLADKTVALRDTPHCKALHEAYDEMLAWLKDLRPSWKPSEDQMDALKELIDDANRAGWVTPGATELYEQLKKL